MDGRRFSRKPSLDAVFTIIRCPCGFAGHRHLFCTGLLAVEGVCPACKGAVNVDVDDGYGRIDEEGSAAVPSRA